MQVQPSVPQGPRGRAVHDPGGGDDILALVEPFLAGHCPDQREPGHGGPSAGLLRAEAEAGPALAHAPPGSHTPPSSSPTSAAAYLLLYSGTQTIKQQHLKHFHHPFT